MGAAHLGKQPRAKLGRPQAAVPAHQFLLLLALNGGGALRVGLENKGGRRWVVRRTGSWAGVEAGGGAGGAAKQAKKKKKNAAGARRPPGEVLRARPCSRTP